jgi:SAM-dependent methyltransferase
MTNSQQTGFSDVDASQRSGELVDYLVAVAVRMADIRREDYEQLLLRDGAAVLDVGCGAGEVCVELAARVGPRGHVSGVDPSEAMIAAAKRAVASSGRSIELSVGSVYKLPFADASFDAARAERVFQHLEDPDAGLREMLRVVRPGGRVMVIDPDHSQGGIALDDPAHRRAFGASLRAQLMMIVNPCSGTRLRGMFVRAGLAQIEQIIRSVELSHSEYMHAMFMHDRLGAAVDAAEITVAEAKALSAELEQRDRAGTFFTNVISYSVVGTKA